MQKIFTTCGKYYKKVKKNVELSVKLMEKQSEVANHYRVP